MSDPLSLLPRNSSELKHGYGDASTGAPITRGLGAVAAFTAKAIADSFAGLIVDRSPSLRHINSKSRQVRAITVTHPMSLCLSWKATVVIAESAGRMVRQVVTILSSNFKFKDQNRPRQVISF